ELEEAAQREEHDASPDGAGGGQAVETRADGTGICWGGFRQSPAQYIDGLRRLAVLLKHCSNDFAAGRPRSAPPACVSFILFQRRGIGLNHSTSFHKQQPCLFRRHFGHEGFGFGQSSTQFRENGGGVDRVGDKERAPVAVRVGGV